MQHWPHLAKKRLRKKGCGWNSHWLSFTLNSPVVFIEGALKGANLGYSYSLYIDSLWTMGSRKRSTRVSQPCNDGLHEMDLQQPLQPCLVGFWSQGIGVARGPHEQVIFAVWWCTSYSGKPNKNENIWLSRKKTESSFFVFQILLVPVMKETKRKQSKEHWSPTWHQRVCV